MTDQPPPSSAYGLTPEQLTEAAAAVRRDAEALNADLKRAHDLVHAAWEFAPRGVPSEITEAMRLADTAAAAETARLRVLADAFDGYAQDA